VVSAILGSLITSIWLRALGGRLTPNKDGRSVIGMATKTTIVLVDDLNGEPADTTLRFGLDDREYELDLTDANAQELRELFGRYISAARKVSGRQRQSAAPAKPVFTAVDPAAVRAWAKGKGIDVSPRGRIKADVIEAYRAAGH
jgi:hypothetical protein